MGGVPYLRVHGRSTLLGSTWEEYINEAVHGRSTLWASTVEEYLKGAVHGKDYLSGGVHGRSRLSSLLDSRFPSAE